jgi:hypothetical protein
MNQTTRALIVEWDRWAYHPIIILSSLVQFQPWGRTLPKHGKNFTIEREGRLLNSYGREGPQTRKSWVNSGRSLQRLLKRNTPLDRSKAGVANQLARPMEDHSVTRFAPAASR